jgi:hypothetical protein
MVVICAEMTRDFQRSKEKVIIQVPRTLDDLQPAEGQWHVIPEEANHVPSYHTCPKQE